MTTPRDDIAGLIERLRDALVDEPNYGKCLRMSLSYEDVEGAADALDSLLKERDALQARVKELEARPPLLDAKSIPGVDALMRTFESRALRAEQERDEAYERAAKVAEDCVEYEPGYYCDSCKSVSYSPHQASAAIRRLAAGPEKEG